MLSALIIGVGFVAFLSQLWPRTADGRIDMWRAEP
jgi:hypothetical protein